MRYAKTSLPLLFMFVRLTALASTPDSTNATDTTKTVSAKQVVVSATRWNEDQRLVPREITSVTARDITIKNPATTADAIAQTGLVHVQKSQLGGGSPMLRGYSANAVLMVIDGVRINNAIYRGGNLQSVIMVDASSLDGVEVLFGPGSVQYGSDALGGVMNFRTRAPLFIDHGRPLLYAGNAFVRYGTAAGEVSGSVSLDFAVGDIASSTVLSVSTFGDLRGGRSFMDAYPEFGRRPWYVAQEAGRDSVFRNENDNIQRPTGYNQYNVIQSLGFRLSPTSQLRYTGLFTTSSDIPRYDRLQQMRDSLPRYGEWSYGPQLWTMHALTFTSSAPSALFDQYAVIGSFQYQQESRIDRQLYSQDQRTWTESVFIGALNLDFQKRMSTPGNSEMDFYYGAEAFVNDVGSMALVRDLSSGSTMPTSTRYPDGGSLVGSAAGYAQFRLGLTKTLSLATGLRYTWYSLSSTVADTSIYPFPAADLGFTTSALSGSFGSTWLPTEALTTHVNISTGFRAPNVDDVAKVFDTAPGVLVVPNANLNPEYAVTAEAGIGWSVEDNITLNLNAYRTWSLDAIERRPTTINGMDTVMYDSVPSAVFTNMNVGQANIFGANATLAAQLTHSFGVTSTISWNTGTDITNNIPLRHIPPAFGSVVARWNDGRWSASAEFWWAAAKPYNELPPEEQAKVGINYTRDGTPAWRRVDLSAGFKPGANISLNVRLENVFDLNYYTFASAISSPGRNLVITARTGW